MIPHQKHITMNLLRKWAIKLVLSFSGLFDNLQWVFWGEGVRGHV